VQIRDGFADSETQAEAAEVASNIRAALLEGVEDSFDYGGFDC
jgi:hypothetical protein